VGSPAESIVLPADDPLIGQMVAGRYLVRRQLATGGMCAIYELGHRVLNRRFALKMLSAQLADDPQVLARFNREAEMVAGLCHPNIISILDWDQLDDGTPFIIMELLDGEDLHSRIERRGALPMYELARIADDVLAGLAVAHRAGIVHRDLKPSNIFLARDDGGGERAVLLDFGISKLRGVETEGGMHSMVGTPQYMAPEQMDARRAPIGPAADIWAMGAILHEMATGEPAFDADNLPGLVAKVLNGQPAAIAERRPETPRALEHLVARALDKDPAARPRDAEELRRELKDVLEWCAEQSVTDVEIALAPTDFAGGPATSPPPATDSRNPTIRTELFRAPRRRPGWLLAVATTLAVFATVVALAILLPGGGSRQRPVSSRVLVGRDPMQFAVSSAVTPDRLAAQYEPVLRVLEDELGVPVHMVVVRDYADLTGRLTRGDVDLAWLPALEYVRASRLDPGLHVLAVPVERARDPNYRGIIIAMRGQGIESLKDLVGRTFCYINPTSASGYLYPRTLLRQAGLDPDTIFREAEFVHEHRRVLEALATGRCDAAATYEGLVGKAEEFGYRSDRFQVIAKTGPIPFGPYVASARVPPERAEEIRRALLSLAPGSDAARAVFGGQGDFAGFEPLDERAYDPLRAEAASQSSGAMR
jgi:serine/threonine-protein kinase